MSLFQIFSDGAADIPNQVTKQYHIRPKNLSKGISRAPP